ncbi:MAG TPA: PEP-CTERM sorting domain-containing protein, partial [Pirellulales bacterium]|nr:PEP-CTERM sorting domain-containing protein [Pirellulales bacterium]
VLSRQFFGGVFAPKGDVTLRSLTDVVGAVVAGDQVIAESSADVSYVRNNYLTTIPEPSAILLASIGIIALGGKLIRRRRFS